MCICINVKNQCDETAAYGGTTKKSYKIDKAHMYAKKSATKKWYANILYGNLEESLVYLLCIKW